MDYIKQSLENKQNLRNLITFLVYLAIFTLSVIKSVIGINNITSIPVLTSLINIVLSGICLILMRKTDVQNITMLFAIVWGVLVIALVF